MLQINFSKGVHFANIRCPLVVVLFADSGCRCVWQSVRSAVAGGGIFYVVAGTVELYETIESQRPDCISVDSVVVV